MWITVQLTRVLPLNDSCWIIRWFACHIHNIPRIWYPVTFTCSAWWKIDGSRSQLRIEGNFLNNCMKFYTRSRSKNWSMFSPPGSIEFSKWGNGLGTTLFDKSFAIFDLRYWLLLVSHAFTLRPDCTRCSILTRTLHVWLSIQWTSCIKIATISVIL
jgi:hypothetical protein